jgi:hypothetical protein
LGNITGEDLMKIPYPLANESRYPEWMLGLDALRAVDQDPQFGRRCPRK